MKKIAAFITILLLLANTNPATAQEKKIAINGRVVSFEESLPLEGVNVSVKGSENKTGTLADGRFNLSLSPEEKVLIVSLPGYEKREVLLTKERRYEIVLKRSK